MTVKYSYRGRDGYGYEPMRGTDGSIGFDLCAASDLRIDKRTIGLVSTGISIQPPDGLASYVMSRSSMVKRGLVIANGVGVIDPDYRGEIKVPFLNMGKFDEVIKAGERIAQLVFLPIVLPTFLRCDNLSNTARGDGGFGSTGT